MEMYKQCCIREEILNNEITAYPNYLEFFNHSAIFFFFLIKCWAILSLGYTEVGYCVQCLINTLVKGGFG